MISFNEIIENIIDDVNDAENFRLKKLKERKQKKIKAIIVASLLLIISICISIIHYNGWIIIGGLVISIILFFIIRGSQLINFEKYLRNKLIPIFLNKALPDLSFLPYKFIKENDFDKSKFLWSSTKYSGKNYFKGHFNDFDIEFSELKLTDSTTNSVDIIFKGPFCIINLPFQFTGRTTVKTFNKNTSLDRTIGNFFNKVFDIGDPELKIGNDEFKKNFKVFSTDETLSNLFLTSELQIILTELINSYGLNIYLTLNENNLYLGLDRYEELFPINIKKEINRELIKNYYKNLNHLLNIFNTIIAMIKYAYEKRENFFNRFSEHEPIKY